MIIWNPWHGCHKVSEGCQHCYMYFLDRMRGIDTSRVTRNAGFDMPLRRGRDGKFKIAPGMELLVGLSTDFFVGNLRGQTPKNPPSPSKKKSHFLLAQTAEILLHFAPWTS